MKERFKKLVSYVKGWQIIVASVAATIALVGPWVLKIDSRYAKAGEVFTTNQQIQQSLESLTERVDVKIAKDKYDDARSDKLKFLTTYGTDFIKYTPAQKELWLALEEQYEDAKIEYEASLKGDKDPQ